MRIYVHCASRLNTDFVSVATNSSSKDDQFITSVGNHIYETLREHWTNAPHTPVGEQRERMVEKFSEQHRVRILIEVRYRSRLPFLRLEIDRPDQTPRGTVSMRLANDVKQHLFIALFALIEKNPQALSDCVFMYDGKIVKHSRDRIKLDQCQKN